MEFCEVVNAAKGEAMKKIVLTGGGTAGHVTPNLALIPRLQRDGWEVYYIGAKDSVEQNLVSGLPKVTYYGVSCGKLRRYFDVKNFTDPARVVKGVFEARRYIHQIQPNVVFSKGGFVSVPVVYGAWMNGVPVVCHESDMTPGLANKLSTPLAKCVCCTFAEAAKLAGKKACIRERPFARKFFPEAGTAGWNAFNSNKTAPY